MARPKRKKQRDQDLINERMAKEGRNAMSPLMKKSFESDQAIGSRNESAGFTAKGDKFVGAAEIAKQKAQDEVKGRAEEIVKKESEVQQQALLEQQQAEQQAQLEQTAQIELQPKEPTIEEQRRVGEISFGNAYGFVFDEETGERLSIGGANPLTGGDVFDAVSLLAGGGIITASEKVVGKKAAEVVAKKTAQGVGRAAINKGLGLVKSQVGKLVGVGILGGVVGGIGGAISKDILEGGASDTQAALNTIGDLSTEVVGSAKLSGTTIEQANQDLDFLESELDRLESELKKGVISNTVLKLSGQWEDINADILERRKKINNARDELFYLQLTDPDTVELAYYVNDLRKKYGVEKDTVQDIYNGIAK
jgi:hypothetical protein